MKESERESERRGLPLATVLGASGGAGRQRWMLLVGLVVAAVAVVLLFTGSIGTGITFLLAGGALVVTGARATFVTARWRNPELHLPSTAPLRLGDDVVARFRRVANDADTAAGAQVSAWLTCTEAVTRADHSVGDRNRSVGSTNQTVTNVLYRADLAVRPFVEGAVVEADLRVVIPVFDAPPSMDLQHNDIIWKLEVRIEAPNGPDDTSSFVVMVAPEVAPALLTPGAATS